MVRSLCLALALLALPAARAQRAWSLGATAHYGFLWPHRPNMGVLVQGHAPAFELFAERPVAGDRPWHRAFGLPRYGLLALHTRMANPQRIGAAIGLAPYLWMPLARRQRLSLGLRMAWGVGYVAKPFDRRENVKQIAIGSRINTAIQLMPSLRWERGRLAVHAGLAIDHWSNGSLKQPNLGLNFLSAALGASCALSGAPAAAAAPDSGAFERGRREFSLMGAAGISEAGQPLNGARSVYALSGEASRRRGRMGAWSAGFDVFNKGDLSTQHERLAGRGRTALTQVGVRGGGALLLGRGELFFHFGAYVITPVPDDAPVYQRIGGRYRLGRHLLAGIGLKTHFATADHWELAIGYRWE